MNSASIILDDPTWVIVAKGVLIFALCVVLTLLSVWGERRIVARMQMRMGPNRVGPFGLVQALADGVKLALKEDIIPKAADRAVFILAPIISATTCFMAFAVIPLTGTVTLFGEETIMQLTDLPVGVLYVLATASIGVYGIVLAGWSSGSTYPLLGGLRSSAQV
ncbi:MAG: complex I subunit 1/NuoH family protein, partial [Actinomycetota bacterium]